MNFWRNNIRQVNPVLIIIKKHGNRIIQLRRTIIKHCDQLKISFSIQSIPDHINFLSFSPRVNIRSFHNKKSYFTQSHKQFCMFQKLPDLEFASMSKFLSNFHWHYALFVIIMTNQSNSPKRLRMHCVIHIYVGYWVVALY